MCQQSFTCRHLLLPGADGRWTPVDFQEFCFPTEYLLHFCVAPLPPDNGQGTCEPWFDLAQRVCEPGCHQRFIAGHLADVPRFDQQPRYQAPQRQTRNVACPHVCQQLRATCMGPTTRCPWSEAIQYAGVTEVFNEEAQQLRAAKGLQPGVHAEANDFWMKATGLRQ